MRDEAQRTEKGTLEHVVSDIDFRRKKGRRVWHARLIDPPRPPVNIFVADWFPSALRNDQRVEVGGKIRGKYGYLEVKSLTDLDTNATFARKRARGGRNHEPLEGSAVDVFDLRVGETPPTGYSFNLRGASGGRQAVLMRGFRRDGTLLDTGVGASTRVRVFGSKDAHNVIHAQKLDYIGTDGKPMGSLRVFASLSWKQMAVLILFVIVLAAFAVGPWLTRLFEDRLNLGLFWTAVSALILLGLVTLGLRLWRRFR